MNKSSKIYVAGHTGLVGSALVRCLNGKQFVNVVVRSHSQLDLTDQLSTREFFQLEKPDVVILAAAKVGGIVANNSFPADFIRINLAIQNNVIEEAYRSGVQELIFLGSSCIYPRMSAQPIKEEYLLSGPLEATNRPYALAKIAGIELCWSFNRQYGTKYIAVMPTNLYGVGDNYDLTTSHVIPALIRKIHEATINNKREFEAWGTGCVFREFLSNDDLARAIIFLMTLPSDKLTDCFQDSNPPLINVGSSCEIEIRELVAVIANVIGFKGEVIWDRTQPDGTPRKLLDNTKLRELGWEPSIKLAEGIKMAYRDYLEQLS